MIAPLPLLDEATDTEAHLVMGNTLLFYCDDDIVLMAGSIC
jgi:hypothetical protein